MNLTASILIAGLSISLASCLPENSPEDQEYSITKMGLQQIEGHKKWSYDNSVTFTATQKYKIKNESGLKEPHWLSFRVTSRSGDTVLQDTVDWIEVVNDGELEFECSNYFNITANEEKDLAPISCDFELVGIVLMDAKATPYTPKDSKSDTGS